MHPMLKEGVSLGIYHYEDSDEPQYFAENPKGEEFVISYELYKALLHADGTKPMMLRHCGGEKTIEKLKRYGIITTSRFVTDGELFNRFILFPIGFGAVKFRPFCVLANHLLPFLSLLMFTVGVVLCLTTKSPLYFEFNLALYYGLVILSLSAHELGHFIAGISAKYEFSDVGILLLTVFPVGAYVAHEEKENATDAEKLQLALSGILVNLLIAGTFFAGAALCRTTDYTFTAVAQANCILAAVNLLPAEGFDGESALSALFGVDSISKIARKWLTNTKRRRKLFRSGITGYACFCLFGFIMLSKVLVWMFLIADIMFILIGVL